jgi:polysaccharide biosynthesis transport protein
MTQSIIRDSGFDVVLSILKRRIWLGLATFVATLSLGVPFALFLPNVYRGVATVSIENLDTSGLIRVNFTELETRLIQIQQELLSRARLSDVVIRLNLYPAWRAHGSMEGVLGAMRRDIHIELSRGDPRRPTAIGLKISYIGLDARSAAAVPNALAALYVEENTKIRERQTSEIAEFLKAQVAAAHREVDVQQTRLDRFREERAGQLPEQVSLNMVTLERLNTRLRLNSDDQLRIRELQDRLAGGLPSADNGADPLQSARQRLADLKTKFTDQHPDVIRTKTEIAELEKQRAASPRPATVASAGRMGPTEATLASLQSEEKTLRSEIAAYEQRIQAAPRVEQEIEALQRDYSSAKDSYASILKRYEEAQLADSLEQTKKLESFRVLDAAIVPTGPAAPNRRRLLMISFFFAIVSAIGMMLLAEHLDTSFHSVGELRQFTTVPVLASIPYVSSRTPLLTVLRIAATVVAVAFLCGALASFAYRAARDNTQLVWMLSAPQL